MAWQKRIQHEVKNIIQFSIRPTEDPFVWIAQLPGPPTTPYEGAVFDIECRICSGYPFRAPAVRFLTPIYHANIHESGAPYCPLMMEEWSPSKTLQSMLLYLQDLLLHPHPSYGYNYEASQLLQQDKDAYLQIAATWSKKPTTESTLNNDTGSKTTD
jgi:ubiquitin-protein ligase